MVLTHTCHQSGNYSGRLSWGIRAWLFVLEVRVRGDDVEWVPDDQMTL